MIKTIIVSIFLAFAAVNAGNVYVCLSGTAYAYHQDRYCRGLNKCTHTIKEVPERFAIDSLNRRKCGYCY